MNCDLVFDILTRGPFPSGHDTDEAVQHHLAACHECHELAEALRPAVGLFHESMTADEHAALPSFHGEAVPSVAGDLATAVQVAIAQESCAADSQPSPPRDAARVVRGLTWLAAAALIVIAAISLSSFTGTPAPDGSRDAAQANEAGTPDRNFQPDEQGKQFLASFKLPAKCMAVSQAADDGSSAAHLCCTTCHSVNSAQRPAVNVVATLAQTCKACHIQ